jgi:hypothetical protein
MNSLKQIIIATALSLFSVCYLGAAQAAAETVEPLQGVSFHTEKKDAVAYYLFNSGACKVVLTLTDKTAYAPTRVEEAVEAGTSILHQVDDGKALEFACHADAQAMTITLLSTVAAKR